MKRITLVFSVILIFGMLLSACAPAPAAAPATEPTKAPVATQASAAKPAKAPGDLKIVLVTPYGAIPYWQQIEEGMKAANKAFGTKVEYVGPSELDLNAQLQAIDTAIASKVDGIITNSYQPQSFLPHLKKAQEAGIPVVLVDADDPNSPRATYIGTSNEAAGYDGGKAMAKCMNGKGDVAIVTGVIGSQSIDDRVTGFERALKEYPDMKVVTKEVTDVDLQKANEKSSTILATYPNVAGMFGTTEPDVIGASQAAEQKGKKVCVVGFDDNPQTLDYIRKGVAYATIVQKPYTMGYKSVEIMLDILNGKKVDPIYDTGVTTVTKENVDNYKNIK